MSQLQEGRNGYFRPEGMPDPFEHFLAERPELMNFLCERKGKDYVFTATNEEGFTFPQAMEVKQLHAGATWAVAQSPIGEALKRAFPQRRDYLRNLCKTIMVIFL